MYMDIRPLLPLPTDTSVTGRFGAKHHSMDLTDLLNRLAAIDSELTRLENERALAQTAANSAELARLDAEITRLKKTTADLREEFKRQQGHGR